MTPSDLRARASQMRIMQTDDGATAEMLEDAADEIEGLRATILRFIDLAESYPDSPNDIRPQVSTLGRNALNLPGNPS